VAAVLFRDQLPSQWSLATRRHSGRLGAVLANSRWGLRVGELSRNEHNPAVRRALVSNNLPPPLWTRSTQTTQRHITLDRWLCPNAARFPFLSLHWSCLRRPRPTSRRRRRRAQVRLP